MTNIKQIDRERERERERELEHSIKDTSKALIVFLQFKTAYPENSSNACEGSVNWLSANIRKI